MLVKIIENNKDEILTVSSREVADDFEKRHSDVIRTIENLISENAILRSSQYFIESYYKTNGNNKNYKEYLLTRDGFSLLVMGFTGQKALEWKLKYIQAFNYMENELKKRYKERQQWQIERDKGIIVRHILTDTIKMKISDSPHKKFAYPNYTKLIYKTLFNKTLKELQEEYGVKKKESIREYLTSEQLKEVEQMEMLVSSLISIGMGYGEIKNFINEKYTKSIAD